jgi:hypothetical protein
MGAVSPPADRVSAESAADSEAQLLDQFLAYLERRRKATQNRFDELARRRGSMSASERNLAHEALRIRAAELSGELRRLTMAASLTRGLLTPSLRRREGRLDGHPGRSDEEEQ